MKEGLNRIPCTACSQTESKFKRFCHECHGVGYIEVFVKPKGCTGKQPACPIGFDPMVGGWECPKCGRSGPL